MNGAIFEQSNLSGADLRQATNFSIDPEINKINKAQFFSANLAGLLSKYQLQIE